MIFLKSAKRYRLLIVALLVIGLLLGTFVFITYGLFYRQLTHRVSVEGNQQLAIQLHQVDAYLDKAKTIMTNEAMSVEYVMKNKNVFQQLLANKQETMNIEAGDAILETLQKFSNEVEDYLTHQTKMLQESVDENFTGVYGYIARDYVDGSGWVPDKDYKPTERDWYTYAQHANGDVVLVSPYVDDMTKDVIVSVSQLLSDNESVLSIDITLNEVQNLTSQISLDGLGYAFILDKNGTVIAHKNSDEIGKNYSDDGNASHKELYRKSETSNFSSNIDGVDSEVFTGQTADGWTIYLVVPTSDLFSAVNKQFGYSAAGALVLYILIAVLLTYLVLKSTKSEDALQISKDTAAKTEQDLQRSKNAFEQVTHYSIITDCKNRYSLNEDLHAIFDRRKLTVQTFTLTNLGELISVYGYDFGDAVLVDVSQKIRGVLQGQAQIYNPFDASFCIVYDMSDTESMSRAEAIGSKIKDILSKAFLVRGVNVMPQVLSSVAVIDENVPHNFDTFVKVVFNV